MSKAPPNTPNKGDRCFLRGRPNGDHGTVILIAGPESEIPLACTVRWDSSNLETQICSLWELEKIAGGEDMTPEYNSETTLRRIREGSPCADGWAKLLATVGETKVDDEPISLLTVLNSNGLGDALWVLSYAMPDDRLARHFRAWCAEQVLPLYEAKYPNDARVRDQIAMLRNDDATDEERKAARDAATAAGSSARAAARAARDVVWAAGGAAGAAASAWAAWAAVAAASARSARTAAGAARDAAGAAAAAWAARDAAGAAARTAARAAQEDQLRKMIGETK